jgi:hypothetical protein
MRRLLYETTHRTAYDYAGSVSVSHHVLRLTARRTARQHCLEHALSIEPQPALTSAHGDYFGNTTQDVYGGTGSLDTDVDGDGQDDTGLFQWSHGDLSLIAKTGTVIPGVGKVFAIAATVITTPQLLFSSPGAAINDAGQVLFCATMTNDDGVLLLATSKP